MRRLPVIFWVLVLALLAIHAPGVLGGKVYGAEDVAGVLWADRARIHNLFSGQESWSFWDPLPFLGMPRLANFQMGWFSPESLYFGVLGPATGWRFFPMLADLGLLAAMYYWLRPRVSAQAAWLGAGFYVFSGECLKISQDSIVKTALIAGVMLLAFHQRWLESGRRRYLLGVGLAASLQTVAGSVTPLFYQLLALPVLWAVQLLEAAPAVRWRRGALGAATFVGASLLCSLPWFPLLEWSGHGSRKLLDGVQLTEAYRLNLPELLASYASEAVALGWVSKMQYAGGYALNANFSLMLLPLVMLAARGPRRRWLLVAALFLALQMLGERGGYLWVLHKLLPFTQQMRAPMRFFFPAGLLWVLLATLGWDALRGRRPWLAWGLGAWALGLNFWLLQPQISSSYVPAEAFAGMPLPPAGAGLQRLAVDYSKKPPPPLPWLSYPLSTGRATLVMPHLLSEQHYFRGLLFSHYGEKALAALPRLLFSFTPVPPAHPERPLLRSWGLEWVMRWGEQGFGWMQQAVPARHRCVVQVVALPDLAAEEQWASRTDWDPMLQAGLSGPSVELGASPAHVSVIVESADQQILVTEGPASLLISGDNWDPGWQCLIDGQPAEVRRANLALKACLMPEGRHEVRWLYRPLWFSKAAAAMLFGLVLLCGVGWRVQHEYPGEGLHGPR